MTGYDYELIRTVDLTYVDKKKICHVAAPDRPDSRATKHSHTVLLAFFCQKIYLGHEPDPNKSLQDPQHLQSGNTDFPPSAPW
jgi:hypothetical protein